MVAVIGPSAATARHSASGTRGTVLSKSHPTRRATRDLSARLGLLASRRDGLLQAAIVLAAVSSYELARLALRPDWRLAERDARSIGRLEHAVGLAWERPIQHFALGVPGVAEGANWLYLGGNFLLTGLFFLWLFRRDRDGYALMRNAFLLATAAAWIVQWRFPTAPPRLTGIGVEDTLRRLSGIDIGSPGHDAFTDPVASMPSLHAGWAFGVALGMLRHARSVASKLAGLAYAVAVDAAVIATGNHFVLDVLCGSCLVAASAGLVQLAEKERGKLWTRRGVEQSGSSPGS